MEQNPNLLFLRDSLPDARLVALQGGTRSGKTFSVLQYLISLCHTYSGLLISVVRESFPALRATALRDFLEILKTNGLYNEANERKPPGTYEYDIEGNTIEFFSVDNEQKVRGRKRDILFINEANEISLAKFRQLAFRTSGRIIIDFNPSEPESYIYDQILTRPDCQTLVTTYKDNPHLTPEIINEIEILELADPEYWKVFGQGIRGNVSGAILAHFRVMTESEWPTGKGETVYGLDFGFSAPSALVGVTFYDNAIYAQQIIYKRGLTNPDLIQAVRKASIGTSIIYCDAAEPDRIQEFQRVGFHAVAADKSIKNGLDMIRARPLYIHEDSRELLAEIKNYRYKKNPVTGENTEEPIGLNDHAIDAMRYGVRSHLKRVTGSTKASRPSAKKGLFDE